MDIFLFIISLCCLNAGSNITELIKATEKKFGQNVY